MHQDVELRGAVAEHHQVRRDAAGDQAAQQGPFGGDPHVPLVGDGQLREPGLPGRVADELRAGPGSVASTSAAASSCRSQ